MSLVDYLVLLKPFHSVVTRSSGLSRDLVEARTNVLLCFLLGYAVAARTGADDAEIDRLAEAAHKIVDSWDA